MVASTSGLRARSWTRVGTTFRDEGDGCLGGRAGKKRGAKLAGLGGGEDFHGDRRLGIAQALAGMASRDHPHGDVVLLAGRRGDRVDSRRMGERLHFRHERGGGVLHTMKPELTPASPTRKGGRPFEVFGSKSR